MSVTTYRGTLGYSRARWGCNPFTACARSALVSAPQWACLCMLLSRRWRVWAPINQLVQLRRLRQECLSGKLIATSWNLWSHYFLLRPYACEGEGWRRGNQSLCLKKTCQRLITRLRRRRLQCRWESLWFQVYKFLPIHLESRWFKAFSAGAV